MIWTSTSKQTLLHFHLKFASMFEKTFSVNNKHCNQELKLRDAN